MRCCGITTRHVYVLSLLYAGILSTDAAATTGFLGAACAAVRENFFSNGECRTVPWLPVTHNTSECGPFSCSLFDNPQYGVVGDTEFQCAGLSSDQDTFKFNIEVENEQCHAPVETAFIVVSPSTRSYQKKST